MIVRPLDENGDYMPIYNRNQMIEGSKAVKQVIDMRLTFYSGEWWEDPELGFYAPEFLMNNARSGDVTMLGKYIAAYISETRGVAAISGIDATYANHEMMFFCYVETDDGDIEEVEVDMDGVF